jgi:hypothetical protein
LWNSSTALLCLVTLVSAHLGAALDNGPKGNEWLDLLTFTSAMMAVLAVSICGVVFALFLRVSRQPPDPSKGRG